MKTVTLTFQDAVFIRVCNTFAEAYKLPNTATPQEKAAHYERCLRRYTKEVVQGQELREREAVARETESEDVEIT